jgi:hypothetical protein
MENAHIIPSKIHLSSIKTVLENTVLHEGKFDLTPSYNIQVSHSMMHNLTRELVKIRLYLDVSAELDGKPLPQGGHYEVDFLFKVEDLKDHYQMNNQKPLFGGLFVCTLLAISYSTLRGMMFTLWKDTYLNSLLLPIINVPDLLKNKR